MKIVLLPGMDGTGKLFSALLPYLDNETTQLLPLPSSGAQSYEKLKDYVKAELPNEDYVLVAESFSGPIAVLLAQERFRGLKALVLVATFISPPSKLLLSFAEILPIKLLIKLPFSSATLRAVMLGPNASNSDVSALKAVIDEVPANVLRWRLQAMRSLSLPSEGSSIPCVYIRPTSDRLVPPQKAVELHRCLDNLVEKAVKGPHFVLQANPRDCAAIINDVAASLDGSLQNDRHNARVF